MPSWRSPAYLPPTLSTLSYSQAGQGGWQQSPYGFGEKLWCRTSVYGTHTSSLGRQQAYSEETMWKWEITKPKKRTREEARPWRKEARDPNGISLIALEGEQPSL